MRIWLPERGRVPQRTAAARWLFRRVRRPPGNTDEVVTAFRDGQVTARSNRRIDGFTNAIQEIGYQGIRRGDLVIHSMDGFAGAIGVSDSDGKASPVVHCYEPLVDVHAQYYAYVLRDLALRGFIQSLARGIRERSTAFDAETFRSLVLPFPSLGSQRAIADYLDTKTARIDALVEEKRRMMELLEERWASRLDAAMSQGDGSLVPLKSVALYKEGPGIMAVDFREEGTPLLRIGNLVGDTVKLEGCGYVDPTDARRRWGHLAVHTGELLVSGSATSGLPVVVPNDADGAIPYTGLIRISPRDERLDSEYLRFFLASPRFQSQIDRLKTGIGLQHWGPYHLAQVRMPLPPLDLQMTVVEELTAEAATIGSAVGTLNRQVDLLIEQRQALIAAAVTGELEIPGAAA